MTTTTRPIRCRISASALQHNYRQARRTAPHSRIWAVVKANAYGHGLWRAVDALRDLADGFAVLECETGLALREAGIKQPILLLEGLFSVRDVRRALNADLTTVIHCRAQLDALMAEVRPEDQPRLFIKLNTGMNRLGFAAGELPAVVSALADLPGAHIGWMTHFAEADGPRGVDWQIARFAAMTESAPVGAVSLANSAALLRYPQTHRDWVRPGILLYGASPFAEISADTLGLQPVMTLESALIGVQQLAVGERVGYGGSFVADRPMRVGVVACGYADGYPRHAGTGTPIAVAGQRTRTLGRVSMDMLACDLTDCHPADVGAPVTLWGQGMGGTVAADEVASAAGTIAYELFCAVAPRVPVIFERTT